MMKPKEDLATAKRKRENDCPGGQHWHVGSAGLGLGQFEKEEGLGCLEGPAVSQEVGDGWVCDNCCGEISYRTGLMGELVASKDFPDVYLEEWVTELLQWCWRSFR